jgi:hypothetical protein
MNRLPAYGANAGFTLTEILLAMTLLSAVVVSLLSLTFTVARLSYGSSGVQYSSGVLNEQASRMAALPFDTLNSRAGCKTISTAPFKHTRCITVTTSGRLKTIKIVVTPTDTKLRADSVAFQVSNPAKANPFATNQ